MAITTEIFLADGTNRIFTPESKILSESHCRVDYHYDDADHEVPPTEWDIVNNSIVFNIAPTKDYKVNISTSTDGEDLNTAPTAYAIDAENIKYIINTSNNIDDVRHYAKTYLGSKTSDPAVRNTGDALQTGDLYFNTTTDQMRVYNSGDEWEDVDNSVANIVNTPVIADEDLDKLDIVYISDTDDDTGLPKVSKTTTLTQLPFGMVTKDVDSGDTFNLLIRGVISGVDTSAYDKDTILYTNGAGGYQDKGVSTIIGIVIVSDSDNGSIYVELKDESKKYNQKVKLHKDTKVESGHTMIVDGLEADDDANLTIDGDIVDLRVFLN